MDRSAAESIRTRPGRRDALAVLALFVSSFALYAPTLHYAFVNWDDHVYVLENPWIRSLSLVHLQAIFGNEYLNNYLPLHLLSYLFDYLLWELDPFGYHLHSVLLNAANGVLAWALIAQLTRRR